MNGSGCLDGGLKLGEKKKNIYKLNQFSKDMGLLLNLSD